MDENETLKVWQPRTCHLLTCHDAREITTNFAGFLMTLVEWEPNHGPTVTSTCAAST